MNGVAAFFAGVSTFLAGSGTDAGFLAGSACLTLDVVEAGSFFCSVVGCSTIFDFVYASSITWMGNLRLCSTGSG